jgi:hypothetical protein
LGLSETGTTLAVLSFSSRAFSASAFKLGFKLILNVVFITGVPPRQCDPFQDYGEDYGSNPVPSPEQIERDFQRRRKTFERILNEVGAEI